jgi:Raf kinase inhibitor-like YbhB/YbcL family protein
MTLTLTSPAFLDSTTIPPEHTCDGPDRSPPLFWSGVPANATAFALIVDDPDAPTGAWVHWVLYNLPATYSALPENLPKAELLKQLGGALQGQNDFRRIGYGGPCPPPGKPHRYFFRLYALDATVALRAGATKADVESAMHGHILTTAQLMGTYARKR